jgi:predicted PurR-regulated permease PerM
MWPGSSPSAVVNGAAGLIIAALLIAGLYAGQEILIPLALAGLLGFVLAPLVRRLESWGLPNGLAVPAVIVVLLAALFGGATITGRELAQLLEEVPKHETNLREKARFLHFQLGTQGIWQRAAATLRSVEQEVTDPQDKGAPLQVQVAQNSEPPLFTFFEYTRKSVPSLLTAALALLLTIFVLLQYRDLRDRAVRLMGTAEIGRSTQAFDDAASDLGHYLILQAAVNFGFGTFVGLALWAIGIPSPALWGALTAILRFVPYIGAFISAVFPMALAAMIDPGWWKLIEVAAVFIIGDPLVGQILEPLLFGSQTRLSPLAILLAIAFWTLLWGADRSCARGATDAGDRGVGAACAAARVSSRAAGQRARARAARAALSSAPCRRGSTSGQGRRSMDRRALSGELSRRSRDPCIPERVRR